MDARMPLLERLQAQPPHVRQFVVSAVLGTLGLTSLAIWWAVGLGTVPVSGPRAAPGSSASLIEQRTATRAEQRATAGNSTPATGAGTTEQPDGILYLGARYRAYDVTVTLDRVEFYPSATRAYLTIANESQQELKADLAKSSFAQQLPGTGGNISLSAQPTPVTSVASNGQLQVSLAFAPANGRTPFTLIIGDLAATKSAWQATFSIDPATIVTSGSTKP